MSGFTRRHFLLSTVSASTAFVDSSFGAVERRKRGTIDFSAVIDRIARAVPGAMAQHDIPGLAIALVHGDSLVWSQGFGFTDRSQRAKVTDRTRFGVQSISKTYTAAGVLAGVERKLLGLDDLLTDHMPAFSVRSRFGDAEVRKITVRHLLSHRAGLCHEAPCGNFFDDGSCAFSDHIRSISDTWLVRPVGEAFSYSNLGIDLAAYILQLRSGRPFERFVRDTIFRPLGMRASTFDQDEVLADSSIATGNIGTVEVPRKRIAMFPAGGMYSNVRDMARFVSFQLAGGRASREMATPQFAVPGQIGGYGLGLYSAAAWGTTQLFHGGDGYGYSSDHRWIPEYGLGIVVLSNQERAPLGGLSRQYLEWVVEAQKGFVPPTPALAEIRDPIVTLTPEQLRLLEGSYKPRGMPVVIEAAEGSLLLHAAGSTKRLNAHGPLEFSHGSGRYTFLTDRAGKVRGVQKVDPVYSGNAVERWPLNDTPHDEPGPDRPAWREFTGRYVASSNGIEVGSKVFVRNGYLYIDWRGELKLTEFQPSLFFTPDGDSVEFRPRGMLLGNRSFAAV